MSKAIDRALSALGMIAAVAVVAVVLERGPGAAPVGPALVLAADGGGPLELRTSRAGELIVSASAMIPGSSAAGKVRVTNAGPRAAKLRLAQRRLADSPGPHGGRLSEALKLRITRVRHRRPHARRQRAVYAGTVAAMPRRLSLPALHAGRNRTFRFRVRLPDTGAPPSPTTGDNALRASSTSVDFAWLAKPAHSRG